MSNEMITGMPLKDVVIDAVCPLVTKNPQYLEWYREGGVTALAPTIASTEGARLALNKLALWHRLLSERDDLLQVRNAEDILLANRTDRLGIYFHMQGTDPIEDNLDLVHVYKALGVGMIQLTYNVRNRVGDGCEEPADAGLSRFGAKLIERLNRARVIVDCSHTGVRTSLQAVERSEHPVVLSHSNVRSVFDVPRNAPDELIRAIAKSGGVIGVVGFPGMVARSTRPSMAALIEHIDALVSQVGIEHVGLGIDYYAGQHGVATDEAARNGYEEAVRAGIWSTSYPEPPHHYPEGIETPRSLQKLKEALVSRGYSNLAVQKIFGANWLRVMKAVWG